MGQEGNVELLVVEGLMEAEIIKQKLESFEIPVLLQYEAAGRLFGITMDGLGRVAITVPAERLEEARQLIEEAGNEESTVPPGD
jgi:hypothetical protein